jgi:virginiamycin B lyase
MVRRKSHAPVLATALLVALAALAAVVVNPATATAPTWFDLPVADSFPQGLSAGPDGTTWVANRFASQIARVAPDGTSTTFDLEFGVDPYDIVLGPDGAMWFTENNGSRIGRLTVDGELTEYLLDERSNPTGITVGPDGALWFAQRGVSSIGRITVDGEITSWPTITRGAAPLDITTGPDGALWFTLTAVDKLGRITVDGSMTESPLPAEADAPQWVALGPDGALWFTARGANRIVRVNGGGGLSSFAIPTPGAGLNGIAVGSDGALWFTESTTDAIGRIETTGEISELPLGEGASPTGITTGPDGAIWFSAPGVNRVGRIDVSANTDETPPTVTIVSPRDGAVLTEGEGMLADYACADEPGSGVASCVGPVPDGAIVPNGLGAHVFTVTGTDNEGNSASATHRYVVFDRISGPITNQSVFAAGRTLPIILELGSRPQGPTFANGYPLVRPVDCETGEPTGPDAPADVQANVTPGGRLQLLWRTSGGWAGGCRSLVVRLGLAGWTGADAIFAVRFA